MNRHTKNSFRTSSGAFKPSSSTHQQLRKWVSNSNCTLVITQPLTERTVTRCTSYACALLRPRLQFRSCHNFAKCPFYHVSIFSLRFAGLIRSFADRAFCNGRHQLVCCCDSMIFALIVVFESVGVVVFQCIYLCIGYLCLHCAQFISHDENIKCIGWVRVHFARREKICVIILKRDRLYVSRWKFYQKTLHTDGIIYIYSFGTLFRTNYFTLCVWIKFIRIHEFQIRSANFMSRS